MEINYVTENKRNSLYDYLVVVVIKCLKSLALGSTVKKLVIDLIEIWRELLDSTIV
jgi:hypothetical protein